ncbi:hypothetical protein SAMN05421821_102133 [Mucilaginibacter lappiensis]|uniref:Uncharacterized protein n=1 Tax=Mucilaginibacter lappiensis TaxID=354630 RepID=A0ABR6PFT5_9SPHI|nr:hypothetical protein [Mucilaginibacter lappiensis]MBB6108632.1 hypothetical protein [Mucilaginibacter lappiensis]SIQ30138.1 hypothetical protein SAMN05421821_102133 [Mucilaginibacter lappiensis]
MKKYFVVLLIAGLIACKKNGAGIAPEKVNIPEKVSVIEHANIDYRQEMRGFVIGISKYAKQINSNF